MTITLFVLSGVFAASSGLAYRWIYTVAHQPITTYDERMRRRRNRQNLLIFALVALAYGTFSGALSLALGWAS